LGGPSICPRCKQSISIVDLTRGPRAREWHIKCLACVTCNKRMDSDAKVHVNEQGEWLVYCRNCTVSRIPSEQRRISWLDGF
ncbi:hypothetical protein BDB00DRAFT_776509, partial [Zychaea mexicana]|uniref:uncharacterized protein n=1 Tax=Zychaea mexicana TaxID=64656 RepID=UPI0022FF02D3